MINQFTLLSFANSPTNSVPSAPLNLPLPFILSNFHSPSYTSPTLH